MPALVLDLIGYSWDQLLQLFQAAIGADNYAILAKTVDKIYTAVDQGVIQYFKSELDMLLQKAENFKDELSAGITAALQGMTIELVLQVAKQLIVAVVEKIVSFLNPAGAIYQLVKLIYKAVTFFIENMARILKLVESMKQVVTQAIAGVDPQTIGQTAEGILAKAVVPALDAVARLIGLDSLPSSIRAVLTKLKELAQPPAKAFLGAIGRVLAKGFDTVLGLFGLTGTKPKPLVEPGGCQVRPGEDPKTRTRVWVTPQAEVMVQDRQQQKKPLNAFLQGLAGAPAPQKAGAEKAGKALSSAAQTLKQGLDKKQTGAEVKANQLKRAQVVMRQKELQDQVCGLLGEESGDAMGAMGATCPVPQKGKGTPPKRPPLSLGLALPRPRGQEPAPGSAPPAPPPPEPMAPEPPMIVTQGECACDCGAPGITTNFAGLGSCFVAGVLYADPAGTGRIELALPLGKARTGAPADSEPTGLEQEIIAHPEGFRVAVLRLEPAPGLTLNVKRLYRSDQLQAEHIEVGRKLWLELEHVGVRGWAQAMALQPCPTADRRPGRLILGTYEFSRGHAYDLELAGEPQLIGVTGLHPFWSLDRVQWVTVQNLKLGERLQGIDGPVTVLSRTLRAKPEPVFNIEVDGDHVYRIGRQGLLVHNASAPCPTFSLMPGQNKILESQSINVFHRKSATAHIGTHFSYIVTKKVVANLVHLPSSKSREPKTWMQQLAQYGVIATPPGFGAITGLATVPGVTLGLIGDNVGHIIGNQFGGYADQAQGNGNVFPQNAYINQQPFRKFESYTVAPQIGKGCDVCIEISFSFDKASSTPYRPTNFTYDWWIGPTQQPTTPFDNPK